MENSEIDEKALIKTGDICKKVKEYAKEIIKLGVPLLEIAEKIEDKIRELGGEPAFPINLCIDEIAAHDTPVPGDDRKAEGLLKVDIGVQIDGWIADSAFTLDLEDSDENKKLIKASDFGLAKAIESVKKGKTLAEIGKSVSEAISSLGFSPIKNLSGHEIKQYNLHAGITIPNYDNGNIVKLDSGIYAIEPFATLGDGMVIDGKTSGIFRLDGRKAIRDTLARKILDFIEEKYKGLPFCSRWIASEFGRRALFSLSLMEKTGILHNYPKLIEKTRKKVSQSEETILISSSGIKSLT